VVDNLKMLYAVQYMDKVTNCKCVCDKVMIWTNDQTINIDPCDHIVHKKCLVDKTKCPICGIEVTNYYNEKELIKLSKTDKKYYQKYVDMISIKNPSYLSTRNTKKIIAKLPATVNIISKIMMSKGFDKAKEIVEELLTMFNTEMIVHGENNIIDINKVIIANHTSVVDFMVIPYLFRCGFLSSITILKSYGGRLVKNIVPLLLIDRTKKENTVNKIKEFVKKEGSICLFPEGFQTHPDTITKFRTGAFYADSPVQPVVIKYDPPVYDPSIDKMVEKLLSVDKFNIEVHILPIEYPPFDDQKIENIRKKMGKAANLALSRVSNKDIKDD
jgi:1-acyl-sn-glycerol-3-phosphate acyltransferase